MKTKEELNALKEEVETVSKKLHELTEEELAQVSGGLATVNDGNCGDSVSLMNEKCQCKDKYANMMVTKRVPINPCAGCKYS